MSTPPPQHNPYDGMDISKCPVHHKSAEQFLVQAQQQQQQQQQSQQQPQNPYEGMDISMCPVHNKSAEQFMNNANARLQKDLEFQHIQSSNFLAGAPRFQPATRPVETSDTDVVGDIFPDSLPVFGQRFPLSSTPAKSSIPKSSRSTALPALKVPESAPQVPEHLKQAAQQAQLACTSDEAADVAIGAPVVLPGKDYQEDTWTFPSHQRFYNAMKKKGWNPTEELIPYIVSVHNTVNQQAWSRVMAYEKYHQSSCPNPSLLKFQGRPEDLSPKAHFRSFIGYARPFDRHDWTIDRCGTNVRYVIDFYNGKTTRIDEPAATVLDVRPALDSPGAFIDRARRSVEEYFEMK